MIALVEVHEGEACVESLWKGTFIIFSSQFERIVIAVQLVLQA